MSTNKDHINTRRITFYFSMTDWPAKVMGTVTYNSIPNRRTFLKADRRSSGPGVIRCDVLPIHSADIVFISTSSTYYECQQLSHVSTNTDKHSSAL